MDRVFLDANVLFSMARLAAGRLSPLLQRRNARLITSLYAVRGVRRNLVGAEQHARLDAILAAIEAAEFTPRGTSLPPDVRLHPKDQPILLGAIAAKATHLLTGDRHFNGLFGKRIGGVRVLHPAEYLELPEA